MRPIRGSDHGSRMENFYGGQAEAYDEFRRKMLKGRDEVYGRIDAPADGVWVDMGGGTASNLEYLGASIARLKKIYVVDLAGSMLAVARRRAERHGWTNVETVEADVTTFRPAEGAADVVTFSYSLTMVPDWFAALENARAILKPGGQISVVDFYVSRKHPAECRRRHGWLARSFWPIYFATNNVFPSPDHIPYLERRFTTIRLTEGTTRFPYQFRLPVPYYTFLGRKP
ncbi:MAG TPA: class I SAM-dependent methyltransferase [Thermoguttaceae bacterium]|nr:class I SAM-dependent methyltransferase [Thermoguttaceae bacterium]